MKIDDNNYKMFLRFMLPSFCDFVAEQKNK